MGINLLGLKNIEVIKTEEITVDDEEYLVIHCFQTEYTPKCPNCNSRKNSIHERLERSCRDLDNFGKRVELLLQTRSYKCGYCGKHFTETFKDIDTRAKITKRMRDFLSNESFDMSFTAVGRKHNLSPTTVKRAFNSWRQEMDDKRSEILYAPRVIGLDEAHLAGTMRGVITDSENNTLLELLIDRGEKTFVSFFESLKDKENIEVVVTDMYAPYRAMVYDYFDNKVPVVVDKFHVIQQLQIAFKHTCDELTKRLEKGSLKGFPRRQSLLRKNLEDLDREDKKILARLFKAVPMLDRAYALKESFRTIYKNNNRMDAEESFEKWSKEIPEDEAFYDYNRFIKTVKKWHKEIFNYFDYPFTNAFTENLNGLTKKVNREGNGYSFEVLRAKMLYGSSATSFYSVKKYKNELKKSEKLQNSLGYSLPFGNNNSVRVITEKHFGVNIDELFEEIKNGFLLRKEVDIDDDKS